MYCFSLTLKLKLLYKSFLLSTDCRYSTTHQTTSTDSFPCSSISSLLCYVHVTDRQARLSVKCYSTLFNMWSLDRQTGPVQHTVQHVIPFTQQTDRPSYPSSVTAHCSTRDHSTDRQAQLSVKCYSTLFNIWYYITCTLLEHSLRTSYFCEQLLVWLSTLPASATALPASEPAQSTKSQRHDMC